MQSTPTLPDFDGYGPGTSYLDGVSCPGAKCTSVGTVEYNGGLISQTLMVMTRNGSQWTEQGITDPSGGRGSWLYAVTCTTVAQPSAATTPLSGVRPRRAQMRRQLTTTGQNRGDYLDANEVPSVN